MTRPDPATRRRRRPEEIVAAASVRRGPVTEVPAGVRQSEARCARSISPGRYEIEIIDLVEHPELARSDDIVAIPTLVRRLPAPVAQDHRRSVQHRRVLVGLRMSIPSWRR